MSTPVDQVEVRIGGLTQRTWTSYSIDSNLLVPADAWEVALAQSEISVPAGVTSGADVRVALARNGAQETVLSGKLDDISHAVRRQGQELRLSGRDGAGILLDCSAPIVSMRTLGLADVVAKIVRPLGITRIRIDADSPQMREKVNIEPCDTAWDALRRAAEANGLWPWFEPDGTLVVGGPRYDRAPVATLVLHADGKGNNVEALTETYSMAERYSEVTVLGQSFATGGGVTESEGKNNIRAAVKDDGVSVYRPRVVVDHEAVTAEIARARGRKVISDSRLKGYTLLAEVKGHRTDDGALWTPGQRVTVQSDPHGLNGVYFLMGRRFVGDRSGGQRTHLTLKEDGVWVLDAHPSTRKHRRGKNSLPGAIWDLTTGAQR